MVDTGSKFATGINNTSETGGFCDGDDISEVSECHGCFENFEMPPPPITASPPPPPLYGSITFTHLEENSGMAKLPYLQYVEKQRENLWEPSHVKQLSLIHVYKLGLKPILWGRRFNMERRKAVEDR